MSLNIYARAGAFTIGYRRVPQTLVATTQTLTVTLQDEMPHTTYTAKVIPSYGLMTTTIVVTGKTTTTVTVEIQSTQAVGEGNSITVLAT